MGIVNLLFGVGVLTVLGRAGMSIWGGFQAAAATAARVSLYLSQFGDGWALDGFFDHGQGSKLAATWCWCAPGITTEYTNTNTP